MELSNHITIFEVIFDFFLFDTIQDIFSYLCTFVCIDIIEIMVHLCGVYVVWFTQYIGIIRTIVAISIEIQLDKRIRLAEKRKAKNWDC